MPEHVKKLGNDSGENPRIVDRISELAENSVVQAIVFLTTLVSILVASVTDADAHPPKRVRFQSRESLPVAKWFRKGHYDFSKCSDPDLSPTSAESRRKCNFYDPSNRGIPVFDIKGKFKVPLSQNFQAWELCVIENDDGEMISKRHYFDEVEVADPLTGRVIKEKVYRFCRIDKRLVELIQAIRDELGVAIRIDEGYRTYPHNAATGGKIKGPHPSGIAVDIDLNKTMRHIRSRCQSSLFANTEQGRKVCTLQDKKELASLLFEISWRIMVEMNGGGIGFGGNVVHVDSRKNFSRWSNPENPMPALWLYPSGDGAELRRLTTKMLREGANRRTMRRPHDRERGGVRGR